MPNEPISCPNCGGSDVRQSARDSYVCKHCQTNFRWVDPTRTTFSHEPSVCACGNFARAFCVPCHEPLCNRCKLEWDWIDQEFWGSGSDDAELAIHAIMAKNGIPRDRVTVVCSHCHTEWTRTLEDCRESLRQESKKGRACGVCHSKQVRGRCFVCGVGICSTHRVVCRGCRRLGCYQHVVDSGRFGKLCEECSEDAILRNARSAAARSKAQTAIWLSIGGLLCCSPLALGGLAVGVLALIDFSNGQDQHGKWKALAAIPISALALIITFIFILRR